MSVITCSTLVKSYLVQACFYRFVTKAIPEEAESYYIEHLVITYAGVPHMGCNEMWVCPAFWPHFTEKVKQYIEKIQQTPKGAGASRRPPWVFVVFCSMYCLTFSVKCCQNAGHTHISLHPMWGTPAYVITFCLM